MPPGHFVSVPGEGCVASERAQRALVLRRAGRTYPEIALELGTGAVRARALVLKATRDEFGQWELDADTKASIGYSPKR